MSLEPIIELNWWGYVLVALAMTHITIVSVTLYLHRYQTHRALTLHPIVSHFFRFWLWLTTGQVTREWVAVHRKHHAKVEDFDDPHSPQIYGINRVLWGGAFLYHTESHKPETLEQYGFGCPDDWLERNIYTPTTYLGPVLMLGLDLVLFGLGAGLAIWFTQMLWIPFWAAGVINGIGHYWGYRNFNVADASRNIVPWGFIIGGEELHNNHHAFASSAKFSAKQWEFDLGWGYIRLLESLGLAKVKKLPPEIVCQPGKRYCDRETVRAVLANRFQVSSNYFKEVTARVWSEELGKINRKLEKPRWAVVKRARRLLAREQETLDPASRSRLELVLENYPRLQTVYQMKQRLHEIWNRSSMSQENLLKALEEWCRSAEASGVEALRDFSERLRSYTLRPAQN